MSGQVANIPPVASVTLLPPPPPPPTTQEKTLVICSCCSVYVLCRIVLVCLSRVE